MVLGWGAASHGVSTMFVQDTDSKSKGKWIVRWQKKGEIHNRDIQAEY